MTDAKRQTLNAERLLLVNKAIRAKVKSVLATLEFYGFRPLIAKEVWRDPATQLGMFRRGVSKRKWGFHCATEGGKPASLAADIVDTDNSTNDDPSVDDDSGWDAPPRFWLTLGYAAKAQGLRWGGYWGLSSARKTGLEAALPSVKNSAKVSASVKFGWDVAHVEIAGISVAEARRQST